jgi:hypothetical protein
MKSEKITAKEANDLVLDYEGVVFIDKVYGMIQRGAKCGGSEIYLYNEEEYFLNKNVDFLQKLKDDGFKVEKDKLRSRTIISW